jgi:hypothetical protein
MSLDVIGDIFLGIIGIGIPIVILARIIYLGCTHGDGGIFVSDSSQIILPPKKKEKKCSIKK